jgi:hypothetical protein
MGHPWHDYQYFQKYGKPFERLVQVTSNDYAYAKNEKLLEYYPNDADGSDFRQPLKFFQNFSIRRLTESMPQS